MPISPKETSNYLQYLPAIFSENPFLGRFLLAFEQVLTGLPESEIQPQKGLEEIIANISKLFSPLEMGEIVSDIAQLAAPEPGSPFNRLELEKDFLQWLAGWTALSLRADWTPDQQRQFLANIVPLYHFRGTKDNLVQLLKIYTGGLDVTVTEPEDTPFQIKKHSTIGVDTWIGGGIPNYFRVNLKIPNPKLETLERQRQIVSALIDLQKPAHASYDLTIEFTTARIGIRSTLGRNMILGNVAELKTMQLGVQSTIGDDTYLLSTSITNK